MSPGLNGTGLVADDLYLLAHNDSTGKPYVQPRALGLGLAGALLAELVLTGHLVLIEPDRLVVADSRPPRNGLDSHILYLVLSEHEPRPVRDWLLFLARTAAEDVAHRLQRAGYLTRSAARWRSERWMPLDPDCAFAPILRALAAMDTARPLTAHSAILAGLVVACGLEFRLAQYAPPNPGRSVAAAAAQLPPGLWELIAQTQAAVDSALLSHRV